MTKMTKAEKKAAKLAEKAKIKAMSFKERRAYYKSKGMTWKQAFRVIKWSIFGFGIFCLVCVTIMIIQTNTTDKQITKAVHTAEAKTKTTTTKHATTKHKDPIGTVVKEKQSDWDKAEYPIHTIADNGDFFGLESNVVQKGKAGNYIVISKAITKDTQYQANVEKLENGQWKLIEKDNYGGPLSIDMKMVDKNEPYLFQYYDGSGFIVNDSLLYNTGDLNWTGTYRYVVTFTDNSNGKLQQRLYSPQFNLE